MRPRLLVLALVLAAGCGGSGTTSPADLGPSVDADVVTGLRGQRYCEVLAATVMPSTVHIDVYNTQGLNDCPDAEWRALDATQLATQLGVSMVLLNGPRYWMLDSFVQASLVDPNPKTFGSIAMRQAATIDLPLAQVSTLGGPYVVHQINRDTTVRFDAGQPVFELVDPMGKIYEMQSYSVQKTALTEADLPSLASRLTLPSGWSYRTRTLDQDLLVTAVGGVGFVVQDDFADSYQQSQQ